MTDYVVYDVFTNHAFGGNQLAVVTDATGIPETDLQRITREFNFSETTFVYPPDDPIHTAKVRIFTPTMEVPFAGHPTIGTAIALRDTGHQGDMILELEIGPIPCTFTGDNAAFTTSAPLDRFAQPEINLVAAALGVSVEAINTATHVPTQAGLGLPFVIAELHTLAQLDACVPSIKDMRIGANLHPAGIDFGLYAYVRQDDQVQARMFAPLDNIPEDPATGSAAAALAALLTEELQTDQTLTILQGVSMGRPSRIMATTASRNPVKVTISGQAVQTMQGKLVY